MEDIYFVPGTEVVEAVWITTGVEEAKATRLVPGAEAVMYPLILNYFQGVHPDHDIIFSQLDWLSMRTWAYASICAVNIQLQFRVQIWNPDKKLHIGLLLDF